VSSMLFILFLYIKYLIIVVLSMVTIQTLPESGAQVSYLFIFLFNMSNSPLIPKSNRGRPNKVTLDSLHESIESIEKCLHESIESIEKHREEREAKLQSELVAMLQSELLAMLDNKFRSFEDNIQRQMDNKL
jgi:hypothetical protein